MSFEWDPRKALENRLKHRVDFADAALALEDERAITIEDEDHDERRFVTLGLDPLGRLLVVVTTWRAGNLRIISARKANRRERKEYGESQYGEQEMP
ncbi:MAG: BrnT family toxin [Acidobacteriota bacterium]